MNRRRLLGLFAATPLAGPITAVAAQHEWDSFDQGHPIYLEGKVTAVQWKDPQVELELRLPEVLKLPLDLEGRTVPDQTAPVDAKKLLAKAVLPTRKDPKWKIELAPLSRMGAWRVPEIEPGTTVGVVGYTFAEKKGDALLRAEVLFVDGKGYPMRSGPA